MDMFTVQSAILDMLLEAICTSQPEVGAVIDRFLQPQSIEDRRAHLRRIGALWFKQGGEPEVLAELGLKLASKTDVDPGVVLSELLIAYGVARDEQRTQEKEADLARRMSELRGLHSVISAANSTLDLDTSLQTVVETVAEVINVEVCSIYLYDKHSDALILRATHGLNTAAVGQVRVGMGQGITGWAAQEGHPIIVADVRNEPRFHVEPALGEEPYRSMLAVPIVLFGADRFQMGADKLQGVISVQAYGPRQFTTEEIDFVETVAGELAFFIVNAQLFHHTDEQLHQKLRELKTLQQVSKRITEELNLDEVLRLIAEKAVDLANVDRADIFRYNEDGVLELAATQGGDSRNGVRTFIEGAIREGRPLAVLNAYNDTRFTDLAHIAASEQFHSLFCMPLHARGHTIGGICLYTREPRHFDYEQVQLLSTFADEAAIVMENARLYAESQRALAVKSAMLQELHHRVRNNLQTISALLTMQLRRTSDDDKSAVVLRDSVARIQAIASVHNLLSREDVGVTTVEAVARQIIESAQVSLVNPERPVTFEARGAEVKVRSREATVLAIVINELVSNAVVHGLAAEGGRVVIEISAADGTVSVEVCDDGPLHGPKLEHTGGTGLGLQIIRTLVDGDLAGTFSLETNENGWTCACVRFPQHLNEEDSL